ncbi:MAG: FKBP-type peptidyl-prolyl cis-trans isomerase [Hyphomonadaceae bacterium]
MRRIAFALALFLAACGQQTPSVSDQIERQEAEQSRVEQQNLAAAQRFLEETSRRPGVQARPSGLLYETVSASANPNLPHPGANATVLVHYEGKLADGTVFDSSFQRGQPAQFPLAGVVPGFAQALGLMRPGDEMIAYLPPELGYGAEGQPPTIPANAALVFRIQLLAFRTPDGQVVEAPRPPAH